MCSPNILLSLNYLDKACQINYLTFDICNIRLTYRCSKTFKGAVKMKYILVLCDGKNRENWSSKDHCRWI